MDNLSVFRYGCLGGAIGYALAFALPFFIALSKEEIRLGEITATKVVGLLGIIPLYVLLGGAAALIFGPDTPKFAIISGLSFEAILKSTTSRTTAGSRAPISRPKKRKAAEPDASIYRTQQSPNEAEE